MSELNYHYNNVIKLHNMEYIQNPFIKYKLADVCGIDIFFPMYNYVYFVKGIAYATDGSLIVALSLNDDINNNKLLINCLNGHKIRKADMQMLNYFNRLFPTSDGIIFLNDDHTMQLDIKSLSTYNSDNEYLKIIEYINKAKIDAKKNKNSESKIKINMLLLQKMGNAISFNDSARFYFLDGKRVFVEFNGYENSCAVFLQKNDVLAD